MSWKEYEHSLQSVAKQLGEDYYPLTELLCKNARVQAEWLNEQNATTFTQTYRDLYCNLGELVNRHIEMTMQNLVLAVSGLRPTCLVSDVQKSQENIKEILIMLKSQDSVAKVEEWTEMYQNLQMKLKVINNVMVEIFHIENNDVIPFFESEG